MALQQARLNSFRLNNSRLNYLFQPKPATTITLWVNGAWVDFSHKARVAEATVTQGLNEVPDTARIRFDGSIGQPLKGQQIAFWGNSPYGDPMIFAGHIIAVRTVYEGTFKHIAYECDCIDFTWTLNFKKVTKRYTGQLGENIISDIVASFGPPGFFFFAYRSLGTIDEITFTNEEPAQAVSRVCERAGVYWYVRSDKYVIVFGSTDVASAGLITQTAPRQSTGLQRHEDLSQLATVIYARGGGAGAAADAVAGQTSLPVEDPAWYSANGGMVECGPQRFTYAGVRAASETGSTIGTVLAPPIDSYFLITLSVSGSLTPGNYWLGFSNVTNAGETLVSTRQVTLPSGQAQIVANCIAVPADPAILGYRAYIAPVNQGPELLRLIDDATMAGGGTRKYATSGSESLCVFSIVPPQNSQHPLPPTKNTAGQSALTIPAGSTFVSVDELSGFLDAGWAEGPGGQIFSYTGRSATSGPGLLTGIPPSGPGAITAPMKSGTIKSAPHLFGIPGTGADAIKYAIKTGDEVYVCIERSDAVAIANLQAWIGYGDGKRYDFLTDGRLSLLELIRRADAQLAYMKTPLMTVTFETRDPAVSVGKTITFNTTAPAISGTFLIQRVQISDFPAKAHVKPVNARRQVEASSRMFTFDDLVQQIKLLGRIN